MEQPGVVVELLARHQRLPQRLRLSFQALRRDRQVGLVAQAAQLRPRLYALLEAGLEAALVQQARGRPGMLVPFRLILGCPVGRLGLRAMLALAVVVVLAGQG